ncbi:5-formyltetrahydrofolate cyclo-ligase-like [Lineus longissimus]|uniref:5-formyltetrahydrofolate cyclo-ligase-like n=1 Tax=Lineus longissimus TaxID=88925 RepID=UPI002B4DCF02
MAASAITAAKNVLRKEIKQRIARLTFEEKHSQSAMVVHKVINSSEYKNSERISVFLSMHDEIHTEGILEHIFKSNKKAFIPHYIGDMMEMVRLHSMEDYQQLPETSWKIKQPPDEEKREDALETGGLDMVLVPGLAFTRRGLRLGRGRGYYDKYLSRCVEVTKKRPVLIGLCFYEQLCSRIPVTDDDYVLDKVFYDDKEETEMTAM